MTTNTSTGGQVPRRGNPAWVPGVSGNPGGIGVGRIPRGESWRDVILQVAQEEIKPGLSKRRAIVERAFGLALRGVPWAIQFLVERCEGKAPVAVMIGDARANPLAHLSDAQIHQILEAAESKFIAPTKKEAKKLKLKGSVEGRGDV